MEFGLSIWLRVVGAGDPNPTPTGVRESPIPEIDPNRVTPGMWGFLSFVALILVAVLLYFSMRKQMRRVDFDENSPLAGGDGDDSPAERTSDKSPTQQ